MSIIIINNISSLGGDFINKFIKDIFNKERISKIISIETNFLSWLR